MSSVSFSRAIPEWAQIKSEMRSCISRKYRKVCGAPMTVPFTRTGWSVMVALGTMNDRFPETASGTPMECPPPSTSVAVGL